MLLIILFVKLVQKRRTQRPISLFFANPTNIANANPKPPTPADRVVPVNGWRKLLVASIMDLQVMYVKARRMRYDYM